MATIVSLQPTTAELAGEVRANGSKECGLPLTPRTMTGKSCLLDIHGRGGGAHHSNGLASLSHNLQIVLVSLQSDVAHLLTSEKSHGQAGVTSRIPECLIFCLISSSAKARLQIAQHANCCNPASYLRGVGEAKRKRSRTHFHWTMAFMRWSLPPWPTITRAISSEPARVRRAQQTCLCTFTEVCK